MALFATIERDASEQVRLTTLAHLAADLKDKLNTDPGKAVSVVLYGYLTAVAASDSVKDDIERGLMNKSLSAITKTLVQLGVPIDKIFVGEMVYSAAKARNIDIFLQLAGRTGTEFSGRIRQPRASRAFRVFRNRLRTRS